MKTVYCFDSNNYYVGTQNSFESPLEPGIYLMPANCTDVKPTLKDGYKCKWNGTSWEYEQIPYDVLLYYADGLQHRTVKSDYVVQSGEVIFETEPTEEQLASAFPNYVTAKQKATQSDLTNYVQSILDSKAQEKNYDNGISCASYSTSSNETFKAEANKYIPWRDSVWTTCYAVLAKALAGEKYVDTWANAIPTHEELKAVLPTLEW